MSDDANRLVEQAHPGMATSKMCWAYLAPELRLMILKILTQENQCCLAHLATVCQEWQAVIEQKIFSRLRLVPSRLASFGAIVHRQRPLVKYIWLCVELREYDCSQCEIEESDSWHENNTEIIKGAVRELFCILSSWNSSGSLILDISVHSLSDSKHHFKSLDFECDGNSPEKIEFHDPPHGWVNGKQVFLPPEQSINRLFEDIEIASEYWDDMPEVTAVTGLVLRRQTRRRWEQGSIQELLCLLPRLEEFYYEPWREWTLIDQRYTDQIKSAKALSVASFFIDPHCLTGTQELLKSLILSSLRKLVLFEDFNSEYVTVFQGVHELLDAESSRTTEIVVNKALAESSLELAHLSASFIVDAKWFFKSCQSPWYWNRLKSLVLSSQVLKPSETHAEIHSLLRTAAMAALKMPKLNSMELWNGAKDLAGVFRYQIFMNDQLAQITWRGNWHLSLTPCVVQAWQVVASQHVRSNLRVLTELLNADTVINSHGNAIHHLKLLHPVMHSLSLAQIRKETDY